MWEYRAQIETVHDGDTLTARIDVGFSASVLVSVRLLGVFAPELSQPGGVDTRNHVRDVVRAVESSDGTGRTAWPWVIRTERVRGDGHEVTTFGRYVATVSPAMPGNVESLNECVTRFVAEHGYPTGVGGK